jgi:hypothetical protein
VEEPVVLPEMKKTAYLAILSLISCPFFNNNGIVLPIEQFHSR